MGWNETIVHSRDSQLGAPYDRLHRKIVPGQGAKELHAQEGHVLRGHADSGADLGTCAFTSNGGKLGSFHTPPRASRSSSAPI